MCHTPTCVHLLVRRHSRFSLKLRMNVNYHQEMCRMQTPSQFYLSSNICLNILINILKNTTELQLMKPFINMCAPKAKYS